MDTEGIVKRLSFKQITTASLEALVETLKSKTEHAVRVTNQPPKEWGMVIQRMNESDEFKKFIHNHAHAVMDCEDDCKKAACFVAMALVWGFELALQLIDSSELENLLVN